MATVIKYKFDEFEADLRAAELRKNSNRLKLQMQPFQVLVALLERPQEVVTREELRQRLWPQDTFVDFDHGLNTAMVKLRDVLGDSASKPKFIETIAKRGYRFLGTAEAISEQPAELKPSAQPEVSATTAGNPNLQPASISAETDSTLPRTSRNTRAPLVHAHADHVPDLLSLSAFQLGKHLQGLVQYLGTRRCSRICNLYGNIHGRHCRALVPDLRHGNGLSPAWQQIPRAYARTLCPGYDLGFVAASHC